MFRIGALVSTDDTFILLKHIESLKENPVDTEKVVDKLKGDLSILVTTVSGNTFTIAMSKQIEIYDSHGGPKNVYEMRNAIIDHWIKLSYE